MAVQYAGGTIVNTTFTNTTGTRREIVDGLVAALASAGWTYVSGSGTGDVKIKNVATPQGGQMIVRVYDPGSGSCARLQLYTPDQVKQQAGDIFLFPATGKVWRVIANKHQFFIFVPGSNAPREFACGSTLYVPSFLTSAVPNASFVQGQSKTDTDTSTTVSLFRSITSSYYNNGNWQQNSAWITGTSVVESNNQTNGSGVGVPQMAIPYRKTFGAGEGPYRFADLSWMTYDPWIGWATNIFTDEPLIRGQMWDMVVIGENNLPPDTTFTYDGRSFYNLTIGNTLSNHCVCVAVT